MKDVEYFTFMLPPDIWRRKPRQSDRKMTLEEGPRYHPGATPMLETREVRRLPETAEEMLRNQIKHNGRTRTPEEDKLQAWLVSRIGMKSEKLD